MSVRMITRKREPRQVCMKLTDGSVIRGQVNLYHEETILNRVSDLFTRVKDPFIVVFGATVEEKSEQVVIVNKQNIVWIYPEESPTP
jgi:small nuclear ribonucleoprotein (snRNP)-like protein